MAGISDPIKMSDLMRDTHFIVHLTLIKDWRFRVGFYLMRIGARLMRASIKIEEPSEG